MTKSKKGKPNFNMYLEAEMLLHLRDCAKKRNMSAPDLLRDMISRFLPNEDDADFVILKLPKKLRESPEQIRDWLTVRIPVIQKQLSSAIVPKPTVPTKEQFQTESETLFPEVPSTSDTEPPMEEDQ